MTFNFLITVAKLESWNSTLFFLVSPACLLSVDNFEMNG